MLLRTCPVAVRVCRQHRIGGLARGGGPTCSNRHVPAHAYFLSGAALNPPRSWFTHSANNQAESGADLAKSLNAIDIRDRPNFYDSTVQRYSEMPIHRLTIHELLSAGSNITDERIVSMAQHVQREICTRLARRLLDIQTLPYIVVENPHIQKVHKLYRMAFEKLVEFPKVVYATYTYNYT